MPRGKNVSRQSTKTDPNVGRKYYLPSEAPWGGFIDLRIEPSERSDFDGWVQADEDTVWAGVAETLVDGMQVSIKFDAQSDCYTASYLGKGIAVMEERFCLVARGSTWHEALALVEYKHRVLMDGDWAGYLPRTGKLQKFG